MALVLDVRPGQDARAVLCRTVALRRRGYLDDGFVLRARGLHAMRTVVVASALYGAASDVAVRRSRSGLVTLEVRIGGDAGNVRPPPDHGGAWRVARHTHRAFARLRRSLAARMYSGFMVTAVGSAIPTLLMLLPGHPFTASLSTVCLEHEGRRYKKTRLTVVFQDRWTPAG